MKKYIVLIGLVCCCLSATAQKATAQRKQLTILHTNDTHSTILPLNPNLVDTLKAGRGGFLRRIAMLEEERQKDSNLLLFDSGDFSQGSPYYTLYKGDVEVELMNLMHYDAATIGNHEFDFGLDNMARLFRKANFPIICANYDFSGTPVEGLTKPYVILKRNGVKIGVIGLAPEMKGLVDENKCQGVRYLDPSATCNQWADYLKNKKKCDLVIVVSHLGWQESGMGDQTMMAGARNVDLILGGHSHTFFETLRYTPDADGRLIPVDQNGKHAIFVGKMTLNLEKK